MIENTAMVVNDVTTLIENLENARRQQAEYLDKGNDRAAKAWKRYANRLYDHARKQVEGYRNYCDRQPGRLEYLEGVVKDWEARLEKCKPGKK